MTYENMIDKIGTGSRPIKAAREIFGCAKYSWAVMLRNYCWNKITFARHPDSIVPYHNGVGSYDDIARHIYSSMPHEVQIIAESLS